MPINQILSLASYKRTVESKEEAQEQGPGDQQYQKLPEPIAVLHLIRFSVTARRTETASEAGQRFPSLLVRLRRRISEIGTVIAESAPKGRQTAAQQHDPPISSYAGHSRLLQGTAAFNQGGVSRCAFCGNCSTVDIKASTDKCSRLAGCPGRREWAGRFPPCLHSDYLVDTGRTYFGMREVIVGSEIVKPVFPRLNVSLLGEVSGRFVDIRPSAGNASPSIEALYTDATAPGLATQPGFVQLE